MMSRDDTWTVWLHKVRRLLYANVVETAGHRFTWPAPKSYEHQWLWDSAFHAIVYRWFDVQMARDELLSVTAHQLAAGPDAGMIPHMSYWTGGAAELWGVDTHSLITQPPLLTVAAWLVHERSGDDKFLETMYARVARHHDWFERRRDLHGDGLVCIVHPWESWDASPRWDSLLGLEPFRHERGREARVALAGTVRAYGGDAAALARDGHFCVKAIDINAMRAADLEALGRIAAELGRDGEATSWQERAAAVQRAVRTKLLDNGGYDLAGLHEAPIAVESASAFIALYGGCADGPQAQRLVERLTAPDYWTPYPLPTTPTSSPLFAPQTYWRGNVWLPVNWLIESGLRRYGYERQAQELAQRSIDLVQQNGFWEYFDPLTGQGHGAQQQSWTALALDFLARKMDVGGGLEARRQR